MPTQRHTILLNVNGELFKIAKLFFGPDGSYYLTCPYHEGETAFLTKFTVNYAKPGSIVAASDAIEVALVDDEQRRLKLSHHPDGFLQFSGQGILSGRNQDGSPKGLGIQSWPLHRPIQGPAFGMSIFGYESFARATEASDSDVVFEANEIDVLVSGTSLHLEGHYVPELWRRFVRTSPTGEKFIPILHPAGAVLHLKVLLPDANLATQNFFGMELYSGTGEFHAESGFIFSGSTGNLRRNEQGELLGDGIYAIYPAGDVDTTQHLNFGRPHPPYGNPAVDER